MKNSLAFNNWKMIVDAVNEQTHFTDADFVFPGTVFGSWIPRNSNAHLAIYSAILASELKAEGDVAVCAVLNDEKDHRTDKYEQEWNGFWRFHNLMQFADEFVAVSSTGMSRMNYLALPALVNAVSDPAVSATEIDDAWDAIIELMYDDDAKAFVELARDTGVPAPAEDNIGYEVEGDDGEVIAAGIRSYAIKRNKVDDRSFDGLRVATMHRVKGLEFEYVFVAAVNNRIIPLPSAINKTDVVSEAESITSEKCLLYVAMTRAQKGVYITSYGKKSDFLKP